MDDNKLRLTMKILKMLGILVLTVLFLAKPMTGWGGDTNSAMATPPKSSARVVSTVGTEAAFLSSIARTETVALAVLAAFAYARGEL